MKIKTKTDKNDLLNFYFCLYNLVNLDFFQFQMIFFKFFNFEF